MNAPARHELFTLPEDKSKVEYIEDIALPNAATFEIYLEDHTIGNLLRMKLLEDDRIKFAGYKMPHPLENMIKIKIQTYEGSEPMNVFEENLGQLQRGIAKTLDSFDKELDKQHKD